MRKVAVIGATGAVGRSMVEDLAASSIPEIDLTLYASARSAGQTIPFRGEELKVREFAPQKLAGTDAVLMSAGGAFSREHSKALVAQGCTVVDNSSAWRMEPDVPLIVPETNGDLLTSFRGPGILANPNCSTIQLVVALAPLQRAFGLEMVQVATYQSVSGAGQSGIRELEAQLSAPPSQRSQLTNQFAQPIADNVLPAIAGFDDDGHCFEETKMVLETRKILQQNDLDVMATTVRVPTSHCHGEAVTVRLGREVTRADATAAWRQAEGLSLFCEDDHSELATPLKMQGQKGVAISRVRLPLGAQRSRWLMFWNVADNLKKGASTNSVQILERVLV